MLRLVEYVRSSKEFIDAHQIGNGNGSAGRAGIQFHAFPNVVAETLRAIGLERTERQVAEQACPRRSRYRS